MKNHSYLASECVGNGDVHSKPVVLRKEGEAASGIKERNKGSGGGVAYEEVSRIMYHGSNSKITGSDRPP